MSLQSDRQDAKDAATLKADQAKADQKADVAERAAADKAEKARLANNPNDPSPRHDPSPTAQERRIRADGE